MKKKHLVLLSTTALLLAACGDDVTNVTNETSGVEIVSSIFELGKCTGEFEGEMRFVSEENAIFVCADSAWKNVSAAGKGDSSCSVSALADSSGFKIVCDGDSVGTIASGCRISDSGNGTLVQVCGDDSTTFHIALCGNVPYKTDSEFCYENTVYAKCGEEIYSVGKDVCQDKKVYKNKALAWKNMNPDIDYEVFTDDRDGRVYRSVTIGEQTWMAENLNLEYAHGYGYGCALGLEESCNQFGRFYSWSAAMDSAAVYGEMGKGCGNWAKKDSVCVDSILAGLRIRGICPEGWHLPDTTEWNQLIGFVIDKLDSTDLVNKMIKALVSKSSGGNDEFGFGIQLAGVQVDVLHYKGIGESFISSSFDYDNSEYYSFFVLASNDMCELASAEMAAYSASVRCIKD